MSKTLKKNIEHLQNLKKEKKVVKRNEYLKNSSNELIACLVECIANIVRGNIPLTTKQKNCLRHYTRSLRKLSAVRDTAKAKKALYHQKGGFLPAVLAPILAVAGSLLGEIIAKNI